MAQLKTKKREPIHSDSIINKRTFELKQTTKHLQSHIIDCIDSTMLSLHGFFSVLFPKFLRRKLQIFLISPNLIWKRTKTPWMLLFFIDNLMSPDQENTVWDTCTCFCICNFQIVLVYMCECDLYIFYPFNVQSIGQKLFSDQQHFWPFCNL